jgi:hypothetical protein
MTYSIGQDGTLNKNGQMCYCIHTENGSCTTQCAAFEERAKGRAFLHCIGREIIAPTDMAIAAVDPLGLGDNTSAASAAKPKTRKGKK